MPLALRHDPVGLYLHIPFCERQCHFCAFFTKGFRKERAAEFVADLLAEIRIHGENGSLRGRTVETVYLGGGTPTTLSSDQLVEILETCKRYLPIDPAAEVTVEANPASVDECLLQTLRVAGFNRLSFGVQSFDDRELVAIGSPHSVGEVIRAVEVARTTGWTNLNLDLIYGLPGQSLDRLRVNIESAISLEPDHISFYGFTLEEGTRFARDVAQGSLSLLPEDIWAGIYELGRAMLQAAGYQQYEVSNFARPGHACRHNLGYWSDREWLGFGPSAHSYLNGERASNVESLDTYHRMLACGTVPVAEREPGSQELRLREAIAFGLRSVRGVALKPLELRYGMTPLHRFREPIERLTSGGWLALEGDLLRPTPAGLALADDLAIAFL